MFIIYCNILQYIIFFNINDYKDRDDKKGGNLSRINEIPKEGQLIARFAGKQHIGSKMDDFMQEMIKSNTTSINESNYVSIYFIYDQFNIYYIYYQ